MRAAILTAAMLTAAGLYAQQPARVEALAPILMTEDRRVLDPAILSPALEHPDPLVRRTALVAIGRIGNPDGVLLLLPRLNDPDPAVVTDAFFAMGLLGDPRGVAPIHDRLRLNDSLTPVALVEAATALARIGSAPALELLRGVIIGASDIPQARREAMRGQVVLESWRHGARAPAAELAPLVYDTSLALRWQTLYTLARLGSPEGVDGFLDAVRDRSPLLREVGARGLSRRMADSTGGRHADFVRELLRLLDDEHPAVRISALASLAGHRDSATVGRIATRLRDQDRNIRVAAANTLGAIGGSEAAAALTAVFDDQGEEWAVRQAALHALARAGAAAFASRAAQWGSSRDIFDRQAALTGWAMVRGADPMPFRTALGDSEPALRVIALNSWRQSAGRSDERLREAASTAWMSDDPELRAAALAILADTSTDATIDLLTSAWGSRNPVLQSAALDALIRVSGGERAFLTRLVTPARRGWLERPAEASLRAAAQRGFPALAARWGPVAPIETGKSLQDYRELTARFLLASELPKVVIDVESRGRIELELFARDAPLTVANFMQLVDRGYFNGSRWHRVVPNFVIQDGDPTGLGNGGPGWTIRDEINRFRYDGTMLGMAHSGRDTGGSQWFINLSPQPHLNGGYTIFGRVSGGYNVVPRVLQGDRIRSITRATGP